MAIKAAISILIAALVAVASMVIIVLCAYVWEISSLVFVPTLMLDAAMWCHITRSLVKVFHYELDEAFRIHLEKLKKAYPHRSTNEHF